MRIPTIQHIIYHKVCAEKLKSPQASIFGPFRARILYAYALSNYCKKSRMPEFRANLVAIIFL